MRAGRADPLSGSKIKRQRQLSRIIKNLKAKGEKIVFTNGCFDLLHYGHVRYLEEAARKGDILIVAINSNVSVRRIKGDKRPIVDERERAGIIAALESVDYVVLFDEDTPFKLIKSLRPDILVKGADWDRSRIIGADFVLSYAGKVTTIKLIKDCSTTGLITKIAKTFSDKRY